MRSTDLARALPLVAMVLGNKLGLTVTVQGNMAYTDGKHINLPILPEDDRDSLIAVRGYLDHEAAHVRFTNMDEGKPAGFVGHLMNTLEDIRVEHAMSGLYPGSKQNLTALADLMIRQKLLQLPDPEEKSELHPVSVFDAWLNLKLQSEQLNYPAVKEAYEDASELAHAIFPQDMLDQVASIVAPITQLESTGEVGKMTEDVVAFIKDYIEQQKQQPPPPQGQDGSEQESSESESSDGGQDASGGQQESGSDSANGDQGDQGSENSQSSDQDSKGAAGQGSGQEDFDDSSDDSRKSDVQSSGSSGDGEKQSNQDSSDQSQQQEQGQDGSGRQGGSGMADMLTQLLEADEKDLEGLDRSKALANYLNDKSDDLAEGGQPLGAITIPETVPASPAEQISLERVLGTSSKLRTRLTGMIQSSKLQRNHPKQTGRRLDTRYIARLPLNDLRVFSAKQEKKAVNTAVLILIDRSSSMRGESKMAVAREAALAAAIGVDSIPGTSVCVGAFPTGYANGVMEVLPFGQKPRSNSRNFGVSASGGTPLADAIWWGAVRLMARKEPRKLMLIATDGEANHPAQAKAAVERLTRSGVEMMGLGIKCNAVENVFDDHRVIHTVEELPAALIGMLQDKLRQT